MVKGIAKAVIGEKLGTARTREEKDFCEKSEKKWNFYHLRIFLSKI